MSQRRTFFLFRAPFALGFSFFISASAFASTITNLGLAANDRDGFDLQEAIAAFGVPEGDTDWNGDGDTNDTVLHVRDLAMGVTVNVGVALEFQTIFCDVGQRSVVVDAGYVVCLVSEAGQSQDLNGDGDTKDGVLHVYDSATGLLTNLNRAANQFGVKDGVVGFMVREQDQGASDLNGDGDVNDVVAHAHDLVAGVTQNLGVAAFVAASAPRAPTIGGGRFVFLAVEQAQGATSLNGDGDAADLVLHVYSLASHSVVNLGVAAASNRPLRLVQDRVVFGVPELAQGATDINGDGDAADVVVALIDLVSGAPLNLGLAMIHFDAGDDFIAVWASEGANGQTDLNGDGDALDSVVFVHELSSGVTRNLGLAAPANFQPPPAAVYAAKDVLVVPVHENNQGKVDLNGDGDAADSVLHLHRVAANFTENLRVGGGAQVLVATPERVFFGVEEAAEGVDLNADGDKSDVILHVLDPSAGLLANVGYALFEGVDFAGLRAAFVVPEGNQGSDLNGDGDTQDFVLHLLDGVGHVLQNVELPLRGCLAVDADRALVFVAELGGMDLNGDGDTKDAVAHVVTFGPTECRPIDSFGAGCPGANGAVPKLGLVGCAMAGGTLVGSISGGGAGAVVFLTFSSTPTFLPLGGGCVLYVDPVGMTITGPFLAGPTGSLVALVELPPVPAAFGGFGQAFLIDVVPTLQLSVTNGVGFAYP